MTTHQKLYGRPAFPHELAQMIAAKADAMAKQFEQRCMEELVRDAKRALSRGATVAEIAKQLEMN